MIREGSSTELVAAIRQSSRAIVFVSVPWSDEERDARKVFDAATQVLQTTNSDLQIASFRLDVHQDKIAQRWIEEQGYPEFIEMGAGNLLWTQSGRVISTELSAVALGINGVVARTLLLWSAKKPEFPRPTRLQKFISKVSPAFNICIDATCIGLVVVLFSLQLFATANEDRLIPFGMYAIFCIPVALFAMVQAWDSRRGFGVVAALLLFCWAAYTFIEFVQMGLMGLAG